MEVVTIILERSVVVGLSLDGDRTKRCSNGKLCAPSFTVSSLNTRPRKICADYCDIHPKLRELPAHGKSRV